MKPLEFPASRRKPILYFVIAILAVGFLRFGLSLAGVPDEIATYCSITAVLGIGTAYFGLTSSGWKELFVASYAMTLAYTFVAVIALGYTVVTGQHTIFQRHEHAFGMDAAWHLASMVGSGISFEPLFIFGVMWLIHRVRTFTQQRVRPMSHQPGA
jgi:hypothetical protein